MRAARRLRSCVARITHAHPGTTRLVPFDRCGKRPEDGRFLGSFGAGAPVVGYIDYVAPGRPADDDNAPFQALTIGQHVVAMIAYDEQDLSTAVAVYADSDGNGLVTNVWSIPNAPQLCAIVQRLHYQP